MPRVKAEFRIQQCEEQHMKIKIKTSPQANRETQGSEEARNKGVMVWMTISSKGFLHFCRVNGAINGDVYFDIVTGEALAAMLQAYGEDFTYQQDNSTSHVRKDVTNVFQDLNLNVMP
ncbi:MAG: hypothetical protein EZS28_019234 [Streblomastix strix]|uniref:Tc1-like transposase DDE domain-containing protein n=1 Tax=Streblomastix strix TaxID=222440 RepID=A0A5J4VS61_9EUKA|nr:MAG: hypothetical protein EZS28_019234 [Streblomastix strix]